MNRTTAYGTLVLRLALGAMFIAHAGLKIFVFTLPGTAQFFQTLGLPGPLAYLSFAAELAGGILLIPGVYSRWVAAALIPIVAGATDGGRGEYPAFLLFATAAQALLGDGAYALVNLPRAHKLREEAYA
ncbi:MAG: DoxX family protein [Burkholderiales bacterium]